MPTTNNIDISKITPYFSSLNISEITPNHIRQWQNELKKENYS
ncbi:tyrosine-type recombinase/integrase [Clostridium neonatale]